jgi:SAM-dependent methyltransferase
MDQPHDNSSAGVETVAEATAAQELVRPRRPHDDFTLDELARRYNFRLTSDRRRLFTRLVLKECQAAKGPVCVLDIGCGRGIGRQPGYQTAIRGVADEYWGIDPDESVAPPGSLFDHHQYALMETADLPEDHFDVVYSYMVMEHVAEPDRFMAAVKRCLKPGGVYLMVTPNKRHYFTRTASALHTLRLDEFVLRLIQGKKVQEYHYPVQYRFNDEARITACAEGLGFLPPDFAYTEAEGPLGYFPAPFRPIYHFLAWKRTVIKQPRSLISLVCRITKPPAEGQDSSP